MIITRLQGGLGNQLFQYTAALVVAHGQEQEINADNSYYWYVHNRSYVLKIFSFPVGVIKYSAFPLESLLALPFIGKYWKHVYPVLGRFTLYEEKIPYTYDPNLEHIRKSTYLSGFWQHHQYVDLVAAELMKSLIFPPLSARALKLKDEIKKTESVAIHVRLGDYVGNSTFRICSPDYTRNSIEYISSRVKHPHFFFFSDDIAWCKKEFGLQQNFTFVEGIGDEVSDFHLISMCKHHIIANSTFSWWGARLKSQKGIVIAPADWCGNVNAAKALLYNSWIQMK